MADLTPKIGLRKPIVNSETDWGSRLNESMDILDDAVLTNNLSGDDGVTIIDDGNGNPTVSGFRSEFVAGSGSLQVSIDNNVAGISANTALIVSTSGHLQSNIDAIDNDVTLQEAYDNGDGFITAAGSKPFTVSGTAGMVTSTGTFVDALRLPSFATDPTTQDGDVWINTTTSGIRWQVDSTVFEIQGTPV